MGLFGWMRRGTRGRAVATPAVSPLTVIEGRSHALGVPYMLPKDVQEVNRLDFQHYMLRHMLRGNFAAPVENPRAILDVGTGTGRWAYDMAQAFPAARVTGIDIVPPAAEGNASSAPGHPANYQFVAANVLEGLPFEAGAFDFVHQRLLYGAIPLANWQGVVHELVRVTRPGGWVELVEGGLPQGQGPGMNTLVQYGVALGQKRGIDVRVGSRVDQFLRAASLLNVQMYPVVFPVGPRGDRIGTMAATDLFSIYEGIRGPAVSLGIATREDYDAALNAWRFEVTAYEQTWPFYIAIGQRPLG